MRFMSLLSSGLSTEIPRDRPTGSRGMDYGRLRMLTAPESVSTVMRAPPEPVVNESSFSGVHWLDFSAAGPSSFVIAPLKVDTVNSRAEAGGEEELHRAAHRLDRRACALGGEPAPRTARRPATDSSAARSNEPPVTSSLPFTVEASSSPEASRTVTVPLTASALSAAGGLRHVDRAVDALELDALRGARLGDRAVHGLGRHRAGDAGHRDRGLEALDARPSCRRGRRPRGRS